MISHNAAALVFATNCLLTLSSARRLQTPVPAGSICTDTFIDSDTGNLGQTFPSVTVPCPPANDSSLYKFSFRHNENSEDTTTTTKLSMAASHQGSDPTAGLELWWETSPRCSSCKLEVPEFQVTASVSNADCFDSLNAPNKLCADGTSFSFSNDEPEEIAFAIYNDGQCSGDMTLEVNMVDGNNDITQEGLCLEAITEFCDNPPPCVVTEEKIPKGSICTEPFISPLRDSLGQYFEPLKVPCPPVNDGAYFRFKYRHSENRDEETGTQVSAAASHEGENPTEGLTTWFVSSGPPSCGEAVEKKDSENFIGKVENPLCSGNLDDPNKNCDGISFLQFTGAKEQEVLYAVHNDGGCVGNMTIEASIVDNNYEASPPGKCLEPIDDFCNPIRSTSGAHTFTSAVTFTLAAILALFSSM